MKKFQFLVLILLLVYACKNDKDASDAAITTSGTVTAAPAAINYTVTKVYPHDTSAYTQGLIWYNNQLFEGTGLEGYSKLMKTDLATGKSLQSVALNKNIFGEGITILNDTIYQLTWQNNIVYVYDAKSLRKIKEFTWPYQGWGITHNGKELIISTGSNNLYFVKPSDFGILKTVGVESNLGPVPSLNELEYIDGFVFANQYETDNIFKINPETGKVVGLLDATAIREKNGIAYNPTDANLGFVLNGIAYDSTRKKLLITGKKWAAIFELSLQ